MLPDPSLGRVWLSRKFTGLWARHEKLLGVDKIRCNYGYLTFFSCRKKKKIVKKKKIKKTKGHLPSAKRARKSEPNLTGTVYTVLYRLFSSFIVETFYSD